MRAGQRLFWIEHRTTHGGDEHRAGDMRRFTAYLVAALIIVALPVETGAKVVAVAMSIVGSAVSAVRLFTGRQAQPKTLAFGDMAWAAALTGVVLAHPLEVMFAVLVALGLVEFRFRLSVLATLTLAVSGVVVGSISWSLSHVEARPVTATMLMGVLAGGSASWLYDWVSSLKSETGWASGELAIRNAQLSAVLRVAPLAILVVDDRFAITWTSGQLIQTAGLRQVVGKHAMEVLEPFPRLRSALSDAMCGQEPPPVDLDIAGKLFQASAAPIRAGTGAVIVLVEHTRVSATDHQLRTEQ